MKDLEKIRKKKKRKDRQKGMGTKNTYGTGVKVKVAQSYLTLCNPMDYRVHGILQARILEWVAGPFSRGAFQPRYQIQVFCLAGRFFPAEPPGKPRCIGELYSILCGSLDGQGVWGRMDTCICMAESLCCPPETITTLLITCIAIQN